MLRKRWSADDVSALRLLWADASVARADIPDLLGRTHDGVRRIVVKLGLRSPPATPWVRDLWTESEIVELRRMWPTHSREEIKAKLGRSINAISKKATVLGLGARPMTAEREAERRELAIAVVTRGREVLAQRRAAKAQVVPEPAAPVAIPEPEPEPEPIRTVERVARRCLCCARAFEAPGRFIRLCGECRTQSAGMAA